MQVQGERGLIPASLPQLAAYTLAPKRLHALIQQHFQCIFYFEFNFEFFWINCLNSQVEKECDLLLYVHL